jgi:hypothetical protein
MSIADAQPGDIYVDKYGCVWSIIGRIREPAIIAVRMVPSGTDTPEDKRVCGVSAVLWDGFEPVWKAPQ